MKPIVSSVLPLLGLILTSCEEMGSKFQNLGRGDSLDKSMGISLHGANKTGRAQALYRSPAVANLNQACRSKGTPLHDKNQFQGAGCSTVFGLSLSGKIDSADNGKGAWGDYTRNKEIVGVSLPIPVIEAYQKVHGKAHHICVEVFNPKTGKTIVAPIVDKGPAEWTGNALDLTYKAAHLIGATGKDFMTYKIFPQKKCSTKGTGMI